LKNCVPYFWGFPWAVSQVQGGRGQPPGSFLLGMAQLHRPQGQLVRPAEIVRAVAVLQQHGGVEVVLGGRQRALGDQRRCPRPAPAVALGHRLQALRVGRQVHAVPLVLLVECGQFRMHPPSPL
jgi:hypothetical protein